MTTTRTIVCHLHLSGYGREKRPAVPAQTRRIPRIARLVALAIRMENLICAGGVIEQPTGDLGPRQPGSHHSNYEPAFVGA